MIDLHVHSRISDGSDRPRDIIRKATALGLEAVALTDHDSIDGLEEASLEAHRLGMTFIKGMELSTSYGEGRLIHILGLNLDTSNGRFLRLYNDYRLAREESIHNVFNRLRARGIPIHKDVVAPYVTGGRFDRQAVAKYLVANKYVPTITKAWMDYLDRIPYGYGELIQPTTAFEMIHAAGGKAFLAHYTKPIGLAGYTMEEKMARLEELQTMGLDGIEFHYPTFTQEDTEMAEGFVERFGFLKSGGSDYHGSNRQGIELGIGNGSVNAPYTLLEGIMPLDRETVSA